jgi:large subunit ribosomal protein L7/L12
MMKLTTAELMDAFREMTVLELAGFTAAFEEQFGVNPAANAGHVVSDLRYDGPPPEAEEEPAVVDVVLSEIGGKKIQVIKEVRQLTGLGLKEAKDKVESAPVVILEDAEPDAASRALEILAAAGAVAVLRYR